MPDRGHGVGRGTTNRNSRGSASQRRARKLWLLVTFGDGVKAPCSYCQALVDFDTISSFTKAAAYEAVMDAPASQAGLFKVAEQAFFLFNVGDDPDFTNGQPDPRAVAYRKAGHRSLSVGDMVLVGETAVACGRFGWDIVALPDQL